MTGRPVVAALTAGPAPRALALAKRLVARQSRLALALTVANQAVVNAMIDGRTAAQMEADLLSELNKYEQISALLQIGRKGEKHGGSGKKAG